MNDTTIFPLSSIGYQDGYCIDLQGNVFDTVNCSQLEPNKTKHVVLHLADGTKVKRTIKQLYRQAFNKEYCVDNIAPLDGEEWKPIDSMYKYHVSNMGRVKSYVKYEAALLKPYINEHGYYRVDLIIDKQRYSILVHRLVAFAFIPNDNPVEKKTVDHINMDKADNRQVNLRWLSIADNVKAYNEYLKRECASSVY